MKVSVLAVAAAMSLAGYAHANLVVNGDFEAGNTNFTSDYTYSPGNGVDQGLYTVGSNPRAWHSAFVTSGDHTTGAGLMLIANGSADIGDIIWQSTTIGISAATDYFFEAFVLNAYTLNSPILTFSVSLDGGPELDLATLGVPSVTGVWNGLSTTFNSQGATSATLFLRNAQNAYNGNDFAIDDIWLDTTSIVNPNPTQVPEPATLALLGLGMLGLLRARRHSAV